MIDALQDVRYALRLLRRSPGFVAITLASLALGAGANTAIFQLLDAIRLQTLPVKAPQELVELRIDDMTHARGTWLRDAALTNPLWERIRDRQQAFSGAFAWANDSFEVAQSGEFRRVSGLWVSGDFFTALGIQPVIGRVFTANDDKRGCGVAPGVVLSYGFWQREFGGDWSVIGRKLSIGGNSIAVAGVTPPGFFGLEVGRTFDVALPICSAPALPGMNDRLDSGITWWLTVMGRLKPGVSMAGASAMFRTDSPGIFRATLPAGYPSDSVKPYLAMKLNAIPAGHGISSLREQYSRPLTLLLAVAGMVLLIACANLANLMLARAGARQREVAVRLAVGASRARVARQLLTEGLLLAVAGSALGLLLARVLSRFLVSFLSTGNDLTFVDLSPNFHVFGFAAALAILTCLAFTLAPALRAARGNPAEALKAGGRSVTSGRERFSLRRTLLVSQIAISLALLAGTLLFARSLRNLETLDAGFQPHGILVADVGFPPSRQLPGRAVTFRRELLERLRAIPGVEAAAETTIIPLSGGNWDNRVWMDGSDLAHATVSLRTMIGANYFRMFRTPLLAGREFDEHDLASSAKVAVVNAEFARRLAGGANALGRRFWIEPTPYDPQTAYEIIGIVKNTKYRDLREEFQPIMFLPLSRAALERASSRIMIRSSAGSEALASAVKSVLAATGPDVRYSLHELDTWIQYSLLRERLMAMLSGLFGVLAVVLTAVGLYGVISYTVAQRTNEIGIRMALGAGRSAVVALILREAGLLLAAGLGAGLALTFAAGRATAALLYGLQSNDPLTLFVAGLTLALVTIAASLAPAWRAASLNPVIALRQE